MRSWPPSTPRSDHRHRARRRRQRTLASQRVMHASLDTGMAQNTFANDFVQRIDPDMKAAINPISHAFRDLTRAMAKDSAQGDARGRVADVTLRSRDDFTRERVWSIHGMNLPPLQRKVDSSAAAAPS
jgi:hypothetical protein